MTNKEKTLTAVSVILALIVLGLTVALCVANEKANKYQTILDVACTYSGDTPTCKQGVKILEDMDIKDIKNFNIPSGYKY